MTPGSLEQFEKATASRQLPEVRRCTESLHEPRGISDAPELWNLTTWFQSI